MANSVFPSQIGFVPSGVNQPSQLVFGRNITGAWEAIGIGQGGRPDALESIQMYLTNNLQGGTAATLPVLITLDTSAIEYVISHNISAPKVFNFTLTEVAVCVQEGSTTTEKRMMILGSQTYPTGSA